MVYSLHGFFDSMILHFALFLSVCQFASALPTHTVKDYENQPK